MSRESNKRDTGGSHSPASPLPDPTPQLFSGRMVSAPTAQIFPLPRPSYETEIGRGARLSHPSGVQPYLPPWTGYPIGSGARDGQRFRSEYGIPHQTENYRIISGLRFDLEYERARSRECERRFQEQHRTLAGLRELYERTLERGLKKQRADLSSQFEETEKKLRNKLEEREKEVAECTRQWRKAAGQLNKLRASAQGFYQITDEYMMELIVRLRFSIRNFSLQYFEGKPPKFTLWPKIPHYLGHLRAIIPGKEADINCAIRSERSYQVIQALVWRVLVAEIFNRFTWVGGETGEHFKHLRRKLEPARKSDSHGMERPEPEAERKFQTWSATTVGLLLDAQGPKDQSQAQKDMKEEGSRIVDCLLNTLETMAKFREQDVADELSSIVSEAFAVGKEISRQVARITWTLNFESGHDMPAFDAETMELEPGDHMKPRVVNWVVAPGVMKRGKSTGEGFNHEEMLLKIIVSCDE